MNTPDLLAEKEQISVKNTQVSFDEAGERQKREEIASEKQKSKEEQDVKVGELKKKLDETNPGQSSDNKEIGAKDIPTKKNREGEKSGRQKFKDRFKRSKVNFNISRGKKANWDESFQKGDQKNNLSENTTYKAIFEEIVQKLVNGEENIRDDKYYEAMQRGFNHGTNHRKGDAIIKIFNTLLESKGYEIMEANQKDFKMTIKGAAAYYKLVNKKTGAERKITITPSKEPIIFEK